MAQWFAATAKKLCATGLARTRRTAVSRSLRGALRSMSDVSGSMNTHTSSATPEGASMGTGIEKVTATLHSPKMAPPAKTSRSRKDTRRRLTVTTTMLTSTVTDRPLVRETRNSFETMPARILQASVVSMNRAIESTQLGGGAPRECSGAVAMAWRMLLPVLIGIAAVLVSGCGARGAAGSTPQPGARPGSTAPDLESPTSLSPEDVEVLKAASSVLVNLAGERARVGGGVHGEVDIVLSERVLDPVMCESGSVRSVLGSRLHEGRGRASEVMLLRTEQVRLWREVGLEWLPSPPWDVVDLDSVDRGYPQSATWFHDAFPGVEAYAIMSLPGVDSEAGLALVRFVIGPSAHGVDGVVVLRRQRSAWFVEAVETQSGL